MPTMRAKVEPLRQQEADEERARLPKWLDPAQVVPVERHHGAAQRDPVGLVAEQGRRALDRIHPPVIIIRIAANMIQPTQPVSLAGRTSPRSH